MNKRGIGILLGLSVLAGALSLYTDYRFDRRLAHDRAALVAMEREFMAMETTIASIRAAQAGYTAAGQVPASWMSRRRGSRAPRVKDDSPPSAGWC